MPKDIAEKLRDAIRASGMTQLALSAKTGVPQSVIAKFMTGVDIRISTVSKLANYLGGELHFAPKLPNPAATEPLSVSQSNSMPLRKPPQEEMPKPRPPMKPTETMPLRKPIGLDTGATSSVCEKLVADYEIPLFRQGQLPEGLKTKTDWGKKGRRVTENAKPAGRWRNRGGSATVYVYTIEATEPK